MIDFCIDSRLLGTDKNLTCRDGSYAWTSSVPDDVFYLNGKIKQGNVKCLDTLLKLANITIDFMPQERFVNAMKVVMPRDASDIPWQYVMPVGVHKTFVQKIVEHVIEASKVLPIDYYMGTWVPGNVVIDAIKPAKINVERFTKLIDDNVGNVNVVETFRPDFTGYAPRTIYDRFGSLTGRLTVSSGPGILTLKRDYRDVLTSVTGGRIVSIDFAALEARIILYEASRRCDDIDLYGMIANELSYDRKAVKGAVISELYGSSKHALGESLGIKGKELNSFVKRIKAYFNTKELLERIKTQFYKTGHITNRYGRPVFVDEPLDHIFINYYAQSTGVDVTLLGFSKIVKELEKIAPAIRPLFLLHDALILDVPNEYIDTVNDINHVFVQGYVQKFFLKTTIW